VVTIAVVVIVGVSNMDGFTGRIMISLCDC